MINVINLFELEIGTVKKTLSAAELTALSIWLVEAIHNRDVLPLYMQGVKFAYRRSTHDDESMDFLYFANQPTGMSMVWGRELINKIVGLSNLDYLLDDVYPEAIEHPSRDTSYQVKTFAAQSNGTKLLGYVNTTRDDRSLLPVALAVSKDNHGYEIVRGQHDSNQIYYHF